MRAETKGRAEASDNRLAVRRWLVGVLLLVGAAVFWSLSGAIIKRINEGGSGPHGVVIAFYRSLIAGLALIPISLGQWGTLRSRGGDGRAGGVPRSAVACVVFFTLMTACFVTANTITEAANAIILQYTSTFWVFALSPWILREKPRSGDYWILGLAMTGIALIFMGGDAADTPGMILALAAGFFFALLTMSLRGLRGTNSAVLTVLNNLGSAALLLPAATYFGTLELGARNFFLFLLLGVVQFGLPYYLYTLGLARIPAYQAALITMIEPLLVPIWTYLSVGEKVKPMTMAGGGVILAALLLLIRAARRPAV